MRETAPPRSLLTDHRPDLRRGDEGDDFARALEDAEREACAREMVVRQMADRMRQAAERGGNA